MEADSSGRPYRCWDGTTVAIRWVGHEERRRDIWFRCLHCHSEVCRHTDEAMEALVEEMQRGWRRAARLGSLRAPGLVADAWPFAGTEGRVDERGTLVAIALTLSGLLALGLAYAIVSLTGLAALACLAALVGPPLAIGVVLGVVSAREGLGNRIRRPPLIPRLFRRAAARENHRQR